MFAISRKGQAGTNVFLGKVREIAQHLLVGHAGSKPAENIIDRDAQAADAGFATPLAGLDGDDVLVTHGWTVVLSRADVKRPDNWGVPSFGIAVVGAGSCPRFCTTGRGREAAPTGPGSQLETLPTIENSDSWRVNLEIVAASLLAAFWTIVVQAAAVAWIQDS
jgi:hypothetical protein